MVGLERARPGWASGPGRSSLSFLRILSNPRAVPKPSPGTHLWRQVREWLAVENVWIPSPHEHHAEIFGTLISPGATSQLIPDGHLAALAIAISEIYSDAIPE